MSEERLIKVGRDVVKDRRSMPRAARNTAPESQGAGRGGQPRPEDLIEIRHDGSKSEN